MPKSNHIIYLPGISDHRPWGQDKIIKFWRIFGVRAQFHTIGWADGEDFGPKLERIGNLINKLTTGGSKVSLVGISAGASAALNAYTNNKDKISGVVYICGKIMNPQEVEPSYYRKNPAFKQSLIMSDANVAKLEDNDKQRMLNIRAKIDNLVYAQDNAIPGVRTRVMPVYLHIPGIYTAITLYSPIITHFLKKKTEGPDR